MLKEIKLNRSRGSAYQKILWLFVIGGSITLLVGAGLFLNALLFLAKAKRVPGTVIELVPNHYVYPGGYACAPKVGFWEETRKRRFEFISSESAYPPAYSEDERITVFYDPENPENAKIGDFRNLLVMPIVLFFYGMFFFVIGFLLIRARLSQMRQKEMS